MTVANTTGSGLGWQHQKVRRQLLAELVDGDPCWRCGRPMWRADASGLDSDHVVDRQHGGAGGPERLAHARCNRSAGAMAGNRARRRRRHVDRNDGLPQW